MVTVRLKYKDAEREAEQMEKQRALDNRRALRKVSIYHLPLPSPLPLPLHYYTLVGIGRDVKQRESEWFVT